MLKQRLAGTGNVPPPARGTADVTPRWGSLPPASAQSAPRGGSGGKRSLWGPLGGHRGLERGRLAPQIVLGGRRALGGCSIPRRHGCMVPTKTQHRKSQPAPTSPHPRIPSHPIVSRARSRPSQPRATLLWVFPRRGRPDAAQAARGSAGPASTWLGEGVAGAFWHPPPHERAPLTALSSLQTSQFHCS